MNVSWLGIKGATSTTYLSLFNGTFTISLSVAVAENMITKECMRSDMCNRVYSNGVRCCSEDMCNGAQHTGVFVPLLLAPLAVITLFIWNFTSLFVCLFLHYVVLCVHSILVIFCGSANLWNIFWNLKSGWITEKIILIPVYNSLLLFFFFLLTSTNWCFKINNNFYENFCSYFNNS